ncbi:MAG: NAD-dependent epimerase/dehydratase family protein [Candidatus Nanoarchaeia archaeon]|nr:NAD-dependent epimerase/dehydratase family protein [Candidatus Nanoarchaeia archaeon]MDD5239278.1 NAD-dependent epimerase/dehydratase family protein [Candidatus Nanoarchaeia archaeon]
MKILITGGAGFIGSHLVEKLSKGNEVVVFDNFSEGREEFIKGFKCKIIKGDILDRKAIGDAMKGVDECYHLAADYRVKESYDIPVKNFETDCAGSVNVLEACRKNNVKNFVFTSSCVVYGIADMPTPETAPIRPISNYAAAKAASENYIMSYSHLYGIKGTILRYANIIGQRSTHGICYDFYNKLKKNPKELDILGDGNQKKSYLHVKDTVDASIFAKEHTKGGWDVFNVGSEEQISVKDIAGQITGFMGLKDVHYRFTGGEKGWPGDVPRMLLSIDKMKKLGWKPRYNIREAIADTLKYLKEN